MQLVGAYFGLGLNRIACCWINIYLVTVLLTNFLSCYAVSVLLRRLLSIVMEDNWKERKMEDIPSHWHLAVTVQWKTLRRKMLALLYGALLYRYIFNREAASLAT